MVDKSLATLATFASILATIAFLACFLIILGRFPSVEGMDQNITLIYAYSKTCPHCKPKEAKEVVDSMQDAAKACDLSLNIDLLEVTENPEQAQALDVDATPTLFVKENGSTTRQEDGSVGGLRAFLEDRLAKCSKTA
jgi:hypothetical protein